jgi:hypothetical protein
MRPHSFENVQQRISSQSASEIKLTQADFVRLNKAFFAEIKAKFT